MQVAVVGGGNAGAATATDMFRCGIEATLIATHSDCPKPNQRLAQLRHTRGFPSIRKTDSIGASSPVLSGAREVRSISAA